jgi:hypothetical protein
VRIKPVRKPIVPVIASQKRKTLEKTEDVNIHSSSTPPTTKRVRHGHRTLPAPPLEYMDTSDEDATKVWTTKVDKTLSSLPERFKDVSEKERRRFMDEAQAKILAHDVDWEEFCTWVQDNPIVWFLEYASRDMPWPWSCMQAAVKRGLPLKRLRTLIESDPNTFLPILLRRAVPGELSTIVNIVEWTNVLLTPLEGQPHHHPKDRRWIARDILQLWAHQGMDVTQLNPDMRVLPLWYEWGVRLPHACIRAREGDVLHTTEVLLCQNFTPHTLNREMIKLLINMGMPVSNVWHNITQIISLQLNLVEDDEDGLPYIDHVMFQQFADDLQWFFDCWGDQSLDVLFVDARLHHPTTRLWMLKRIKVTCAALCKDWGAESSKLWTWTDRLAYAIKRIKDPSFVMDCARPPKRAGRYKSGTSPSEVLELVDSWAMHSREHMEVWREIVHLLVQNETSSLSWSAFQDFMNFKVPTFYASFTRQPWKRVCAWYAEMLEDDVVVQQFMEREVHRDMNMHTFRSRLDTNSFVLMMQTLPTFRSTLMKHDPACAALLHLDVKHNLRTDDEHHDDKGEKNNSSTNRQAAEEESSGRGASIPRIGQETDDEEDGEM